MPAEEAARRETGLWKDHFHRGTVRAMAEQIGLAYQRFDRDAFVGAVCDGVFEELELKGRIHHIAKQFRRFLPKEYRRAVGVLVKAAPSLGEFENWVLTTYVELYGLEHFNASMRALKELTRHGTSEFAIRPFVIKYPRRMLTILNLWSADSNEHVRRLVAEGSRPRGVWVQHVESFKADPRPVLELLEKLRADPSPYVRKAVANNLNDISRDHPALVMRTARRWQKSGDPSTRWIIRHGCRTLIKQGYPGVFGILGFTEDPEVSVENFRTSAKRIRIGSELLISFDIVSLSDEAQRLAIDYKVHYRKASGRLSAKVFKLSEKSLRPGERIQASTRHSLRPTTTRRHYPGRHMLELIVNGCVCSSADFTLMA